MGQLACLHVPGSCDRTACAFASVALRGPGLPRQLAEITQPDIRRRAERTEVMTIAGWVFMIVSLSSVLTLLVLCYRKVLSAPRQAAASEDEDDGGVDGP